MKKRWKGVGLSILMMGGMSAFSPAEAVLVTDAVSLQLHNPGDDSTLSQTKSQFVMRNDSDPGVRIVSVLWSPKSPIFFDTAAGGPGLGFSRDYQVSPAEAYTAEGATITVLANSNVLVGYTGLTSIPDGAASLLLTFDDFDPGEAFGVWSDLDTPTSPSVTGVEWDGSKTTITFSNGCVLDYTWDVPQNPGRTFGVEGASAPCGIETVVPEPGTLSLLGMGLLGMWRFRKRNAASFWHHGCS